MANSHPQSQRSDRKRVVITGLGAITPIGNTLAEYWDGLVSGRNGIGEITHFDASKHDCRIAGELKNFDPLLYLEKKAAKRMDRFAQLAVCATKQAIVLMPIALA
jgi:3-oxoacyl-[acyl-carrier-protein] synthase II